MDVCDQESSMNSSAQQDMSDKDESQPAAAPVSKVGTGLWSLHTIEKFKQKNNEMLIS